MKNINRKELNELLNKNENENIYFDQLEIVFQYNLTDGKVKSVQESIQRAFGLKIDNKDYVILLDQYSNSISPFIMLEKNDPKILKILSSTKEIYCINEEKRSANILIDKIIGINERPFGSRIDLNNDVIEKLNSHSNKYLKAFSESLKETLKNIHAEPAANRLPYIKLKDKHINDFKKLYKEQIAEIYNHYDSIYKLDLSIKQQIRAASLREDIKQKTILKNDIEYRKEQNDLLETNNALISVMGYYPKLDVKLDDKKLDFELIDKDNNSIYKNTFNLLTKSFDLFDNNTGIDETFNFYTIDESFKKTINKEDYKKFYHSLFELNDSIICDIDSFDAIDRIKLDNLGDLIDKDNFININKPNLFSKILQENLASEGRLNFINNEMKANFTTSKLKL